MLSCMSRELPLPSKLRRMPTRADLRPRKPQSSKRKKFCSSKRKKASP